MVKLDAFLDRYLERFEQAAVVRRFWQAWNGKGDIAAAWPDFAAQRQAIEQHGKAWVSRIDQTGDLADNLVCFVRGSEPVPHRRRCKTAKIRVTQDRNFKMGIVTAGELNPGNVVMVDKSPLVVMKKSITRSGRNAAICKLRLRNLMTGGNTETVVKSEEKMEMVVLEKKECTYSYYAAPNHVFVDSEFNQYEIDAETIPDLEKYLVPEMSDVCEVTFFEGRPISVVLPKVIVREVEYTEPAARGDTSGKITKAAILKGTKHELQVSAFVEIGDMIEIDTTTDEFRGRCK